MKPRVSKQIKETLQLLNQFQSLRNKCSRVIQENDISVPELDQFKELDTQFAIDLNLLPLEMITARRNKLTKAIDQIIDIESSLHLRVHKKNSQRQVSLNESPDRDQTHSNVSSQNSTANSKQNDRRGTKQNFLTNGYPRVSHTNRIEEEEIKTIKGESTFNPSELNAIWSKNAPPIEESSQDKLDRIAKIVATLRKNVKQITEKERRAIGSIVPIEHPENLKLMEQIEEQNQLIRDLQLKNTKLIEQNIELKRALDSTKTRNTPDNLFDDYKQTLFSNEKFTIVKVLAKTASTRHASLQKHRAVPEANIQAMLKYIFLLQEKIVDSLPIIQSSNPQINRFKKTLQLSNQFETPIQFSKSHSTVQPISKLEESKRFMTKHRASSESNGLKRVGVKLNELRQERKRIFEDDGIWNEIENLKL